MNSGNLAPGAASSFAGAEALLAKQVSGLRDQFLEIAENLASTEEQMAFYWVDAAERHPGKAGRYWRAAQDARANAQRARELAHRFADLH